MWRSIPSTSRNLRHSNDPHFVVPMASSRRQKYSLKRRCAKLFNLLVSDRIIAGEKSLNSNQYNNLVHRIKYLYILGNIELVNYLLTTKVWRLMFTFCDFFIILIILEIMRHPLLVVLSTSPLPAWAYLDAWCPLHRSRTGLSAYSGVSRGQRFWLAGPGRVWSKCRSTGEKVRFFFAILSFWASFWIFLLQKIFQPNMLAVFKFTFCCLKRLLCF